MTIIFDFNRTIYDPETGGLIEGVKEALTIFKERGMELHLVSRREAKERGSLLKDHGVDHLFSSFAFVDEKEEVIREIMASAKAPVYVVGDNLYDEIRAGNRLGARTVWFKSGKLSVLEPQTDDDVPWKVIERMEEIHKIII